MLLIHLVSHHVRRLISLRPRLPLPLVSAEILSLGSPNSLSFQQSLHLRYVSAFQDVQSEPKRLL